MAGDVASEVGFHKIALQIAITSNALNKKEDDTIAMCEGLLQSHQSDSSRYNTPNKRRGELQRLLRYTQDNVCYSYSKGGVRSLLPADVPTPDLDGIVDAAGASASGSMACGLFLMDSGIWQKSEDGAKQICDMAFKDVVLLRDAKSRNEAGFEAELVVNGRPKGRKLIDGNHFLSKAHFQKLAVQHFAQFRGVDAHVTALLGILRDQAEMNNAVVYKVGREGMDLIQRPDTEEDIQDFVWVSTHGVETNSPVISTGDPNIVSPALARLSSRLFLRR